MSIVTKSQVKHLVKDIADTPLLNIKSSTFHKTTELAKAIYKLKELIDKTKYDEAKTLYIELLKTSRFALINTWKVGVEIIGKTSPQDLADYLKAVYINSPAYLAPITFNAYIDQLMLDKQWFTAMDEIELVYPRKNYHHPILLRKMAVCSYRYWQSLREKLPVEYLDDDLYDPNDTTIVRYETYSRTSKKYLSETLEHYERDAELLDMYFTFLTLTGDEETKKAVVLKSLDAFKQRPDYFLLFYLFKINKKDIYFNSKPYILHLYEYDPFLHYSYGLKYYVIRTCSNLKRYMSLDSPEEVRTKYQKRAERLFALFIKRAEHGNLETWYLGCICEDIFKYALSPEICELYKSKEVDKLLKSFFFFQDKKRTKIITKHAAKMEKVMKCK